MVLAAGGPPRRRAADRAIAATARVHEALLLTDNLKDFGAISHLVHVASQEG